MEFDVSLTKDKELVLFHDSQVQVRLDFEKIVRLLITLTVRAKIRQESQVVSQELRNMTASELKQAQVSFCN